MSQRPIIVGGGPAGMAAAIELANHRVPSLLFDEASRTGGVVYRGPLRAGVNLDYLGSRYSKALNQLHDEFAECTQWVETRLNSRIVGGDERRLIALDADEKLHEVDYRHMVLAAGCHERSVPFPGWTLPGVILLGGLQLQIKSGVVKPLGRTLIAGTGPLLPLVACQLHAAGAEVAGVYEACAFNRIAKESLALMNKPQLFLQGLSMLTYMKLHGIAMHYGWGVVRAEGGVELGEVQVAPYDQQWKADLSRTRSENVQTLAVGYGFVPRTRFSQQLGLAHGYSEDGYLRAECNAWQQSNIPHIHLAGDMAGICGGEAGLLTGRLAAVSILQQLGVLDIKQALRQRERYQDKLATLRRFRAGVDRYTARGPLQLELPDAGTVICRCENVTRSAVDLALEQGVADMASLKMRTRVSMGDCQGRMCVGYCSDRLRASTGQQDVGWLRPRFPIDPVPFSAFDSLYKEA